MKKPNSTNRLSDLDQKLTPHRPSPPPSPSSPSPAGSGSLFNLETTLQKPPAGQSLQKPRLQVRTFDDGQPIEVVTHEDHPTPMAARAFDFDEPIAIEQDNPNYATASSWDDDIEQEDIPFQAASFETEAEMSPTAPSTHEPSRHTDALTTEVEALRQDVRSLQQPPSPKPPSSPESEALKARLQEIRDEVQQLQKHKHQQPSQETEALAKQMATLRDELRSLRDNREAEALSHDYWEALELEPTFQEFDEQMDEARSPSLSSAAQYVPVEVVPPQAPDPQTKAMAVELSQQFAEFDQMMDEDEPEHPTREVMDVSPINTNENHSHRNGEIPNPPSNAMAVEQPFAIAMVADNPGADAIEQVATAASRMTGLRIKPASAKDSTVGWLGINVHPAQELETIHQKVVRREASKFLPGSDERQNAEQMALQKFFSFQGAEPELLDPSAVTRFHAAKSQLLALLQDLQSPNAQQQPPEYRSSAKDKLQHLLSDFKEVQLYFEDFPQDDRLEKIDRESLRQIGDNLTQRQGDLDRENDQPALQRLLTLNQRLITEMSRLEQAIPELSKGYDRSFTTEFALAERQLNALSQELRTSSLVTSNDTNYFNLAKKRLLDILLTFDAVVSSFIDFKEYQYFKDANIPILQAVGTAIDDSRNQVNTLNIQPDRFDQLKQACKAIKDDIQQELNPAVTGLAKISTIFTIEPFYLLRLMVPFQIVSAGQITHGDRRNASGNLTKLINNIRSNDPNRKMEWVSVWLLSKMVELKTALEQLDPKKEDLFFHLKGGRAQAYLLNQPDQGENDWDTGIVINPDLPAEYWHTVFNKVHNVVLNKLRKFKQEFFLLIHIHKDEVIQAMNERGQEKEDLEEEDFIEYEDQLIQAMDASNLLSDRPRDPKEEQGSCKTELIDVGIPRRDSVEATEHWYHTRPYLTEYNEVPIPGHLYFVDEYLLMIREALAGFSPAPHKTSKRIRRLFDIMNLNANNDPRLDQVVGRIRQTILQLNIFQQSQGLLNGNLNNNNLPQYVSRLIPVMLNQFTNAYDLKRDVGLTSVFDTTFHNTSTVRNNLELLRQVDQGIQGDESWNNRTTRTGTHDELLRWIQLGAKLSEIFELNFQDRAKFFGFGEEVDESQKRRRNTLESLLKHLYTNSIFSPDENDLEVQLAVCGSFAAYLHAEYNQLEPQLRRKLDPVFCIELKLFTRNRDNFMSDSKPDPQKMKNAINALVSPILDNYLQKPDNLSLNREVKPGGEIHIFWKKETLGHFAYRPLIIKITVEPNLWPQIAFVRGFPVLSLRELIREYDRKAAHAGEWGRIQKLKDTSVILRNLLTSFDF